MPGKRGDRRHGEGEIFQRAYRDKVTGEKRHVATWTIRYYDALGVRHVEQVGLDEKKAAKLLNQRINDAGHGLPVGPVVNKTTYENLEQLIIDDYCANNRKIDRLHQSLVHLRQAFGGLRVMAIDEERLLAYKAYRHQEGAANATVNRELSALLRAFKLGTHARMVGRIPHVAKLDEHNRRKGFFEMSSFHLVRQHLDVDVQYLADAYYITGWRGDSELKTRQWYHVDFGPEVWGCECGVSLRVDSCEICGKDRPGWIRLDPGETKNREGRMFPMTRELRIALTAQRARTDDLEEQLGRPVAWVFWRRLGRVKLEGKWVRQEGARVRSFRRMWLHACWKAGLAERIETPMLDAAGQPVISKRTKKPRVHVKYVTNRIPHDFRRTAVRNLEMAGVDRSTAKEMVGHKTDSIYTRYAIVDAQMMQRASSKLSKLHREQTTTRNVAQFRKRGGEK